MRKLYEHAAATAIVFILSSGVANAIPLPFAEGSFGFTPNAPVVSDTLNLSAATLWTDYPNGAKVNIPSTGNLGINVGTAVGTETFFYVPGLGSGVADLDITVNGLTFHFDTVTMLVHQTGFISASWTGILADGGGVFEEGSLARLTQSCDQIIPGGVKNCSNTTLVAERTVPEPSTLALLGAALIGLGLVSRSKKHAS